MGLQFTLKRKIAAGVLMAAGLLFLFLQREAFQRKAYLFGTILVLIACGLLIAFKFTIKKDSIKIVLAVLSPLINYCIFETTTGNILTIRGIHVLLNLMFFYVFYLVIYAVTNRLRFTILSIQIVTYLIALAEYFVVLFRGRPIMLWDVLAIGTAATVAKTYQYTLSWHCIFAGFSMVFTVLFYSNIPFKIKDIKKRVTVSVLFVAASIAVIMGFYSKSIRKYGLTINMWAPSTSYSSSGYVLCTFVYLGYIKVDPPDGYSLEAVEEIKASLEEIPVLPDKNGIVPKNIICIMNESFSDLGVIGDFSTNKEYLPFINGLDKNTVKGYAYTPVFGSMTCNPEFEFLTGNSIAFLPIGGVAFQLYVNGPTHSLPTMLKEMDYTSIAMHPYPKENWNRDKVYNHMKFDMFLDESEFEEGELVREYISDKETFDKALSLIKEKEEGSSMFIFDVTMQNHGGYELKYDNFEPDVHLTKSSEFPQAETYLSLIRKSDEAFEYLLGELSKLKEPTMVLMFGDHQPSIEPEFFEALYQSSINDLSKEEQLKQYITPFVLWTNYDMEYEYIERLSVSYLPILMFEKANLPMSPYFQYISRMKEELPVAHPLGYYDKEDQFHTWEDWKGQTEYPIFKDFYILQYNNVFDLRKRIDDLFRINYNH